MPIRAWWRAVRDRRAAVERDARALIAERGPRAYEVARVRARGGRLHGPVVDPHWRRVAARVGRLIGRDGLTGADRYPGP